MKYHQMIGSLPIPKLSVFEKVSRVEVIPKYCMNKKETYFLLQVLLKYDQNLERIFLFYIHFTKKAYFRILQIIVDVVV